MASKKSFISSLIWIFAVSRRFSDVDRKGRSAVTSTLAILGISFGVMTLITVISVMNGFQMSFVDAILELSSYHVQVSNLNEYEQAIMHDYLADLKDISAVSPFYESRGLITGGRKNSAVIVRAVDKNCYEVDSGFKKQMKIVQGSFDLCSEDKIILGSSLAKTLSVNIGSEVTLMAMSGSSDMDLLSVSKPFYVAGIFESGYGDINSAYGFINLDAGKNTFGNKNPIYFGIKLKNSSQDMSIVFRLKQKFPNAKVQSWRSFNRSFFGALRIEKNILMFLILLIFVVVGINIYNGMRRLIFERSREISILSALGASVSELQLIFIMKGFLNGFIGAVSGLILGLAVSANMDFIFRFVSHLMYFSSYLFMMVVNPAEAYLVTENPMYEIYAAIPARTFFYEVFLIVMFGILSPVLASWRAGMNVLKMNVSEVLHDE